MAMQRWGGVAEAPGDWGRCVVTIGVFDGVHRGHQQIIDRALAEAHDRNLPCVVLSFSPHPSEVVRPGSHPPILTSPAYKAQLLAEMGVDVVCLQPFTLDYSRLSPEAFVHETLVEQLHAAAVVVGRNFRFGHRARGDLALLTELGAAFGFTVTGVDLVAEGPITLSSTYVRSCIDAGDVRTAAQVLGRPHRIEGVVVRGDMRGRTLGYPTANIETPEHTAIPADGVYAAWLHHRGQRHPAAVSVGTNPTFAGRDRTVEAFLLDFDGDLYGEHVACEFVDRLRGMHRFESREALVAQMDRDVALTRTLLAR